jgi:cytochrome c-type biogenesis protein CcmH
MTAVAVRRPAARRRAIVWVLLVAAAVGLLTTAIVDRGDGSQTNAERVYAIAGQFACPVCQGQSIAESDIPIAKEMRLEISKRLDQGQTESQIRDYLVSNYGENIDYTPRATGVTGLVWIIPVVVVVVALAGLVAVFRRWRAEERFEATDADRDLVARARGTAP